MINLAAGQCVACRGSEPTLTDDEIKDLLFHVVGWQVKEVDSIKRLERAFKFKNFADAVAFTEKIAVIAEEQEHHPLIITEWAGSLSNGGRIRSKVCTEMISSWRQRRMRLPVVEGA